MAKAANPEPVEGQKPPPAPLKSLAAFCRKCMDIPKNCEDTECPLYPHRLGKDLVRSKAAKRAFETGRATSNLPKKA